MPTGEASYTFTCTCGHRESGLTLAEGNDVFDTHLEPAGNHHDPLLRLEEDEQTVSH